MPKKNIELPDESVLAEGVLKTLGQQGQPKTVKELRKPLSGLFKLPEDRLGELMTGLVSGEKIFEWPAKGKGRQRYWTEPLSRFMAEKTVQLLAEKPLTPVELKRNLNKALFGIPKITTEKGIQSLLDQGILLIHPKFGSLKARLGLHPPDPKPYLNKVRKELDQVHKTLGPAGVSREAIHQALMVLLGIPAGPEIFTEAPGMKDVESRLLSKMVEIEPQAPSGALVSLRNLRRSLNFEKGLFDRAIIDLAIKDRIILHQHSFPQGLSEEERQDLVADQRGQYYVGAVLTGR
ncbi:MAG: hypothetical protein HY879_09545 [Deltaproteobacteria bacterium]|nr:hypothetical protein [Deltaproteobacteria bacterium]